MIVKGALIDLQINKKNGHNKLGLYGGVKAKS
jgi:hypothetical protein